ncbi:MAG: restriction endonuclease subunit M, partial [Bacteroidales bacterium]|nr:restriction endonuclease subunit M [Bacteroidales bacterium]
QNNLIDNAWFGIGHENQFNTENPDHTWTTHHSPIQFPAGRTWQDYVLAPRLELTCGEAPYLCSRYDTVSGREIPVSERVGLLDRKLRVVSENVTTSGDWLRWAKNALRCTYGFELQGDSLLIARETAFMTFIDFYRAKFGREVPWQSIKGIAYILSWNLWQMDGLTANVPFLRESCPIQGELFSDAVETIDKDVPCLISDWRIGQKSRQITVFQTNKTYLEPQKS